MSPDQEKKKKPRAPRKPKPVPVAGEPGANGTNGTKARAVNRRNELARELSLELVGLRATLDELTERYRLRVGGQIAELRQRIDGDRRLDPQHKPPAARVSEALLEKIRATKIKAKGRPKDLGKLELLIEELAALLPGE